MERVRRYQQKTVYHIGMPMVVAMQLIDARDSTYRDNLALHRHRARYLHSRGAVHYSVCPKVTKSGLCGCNEDQRNHAEIPPLPKPTNELVNHEQPE